MFSLDGRDLLRLKGAGGERFTRFVDALIRAEASIGRLPQSEIDTQIRTNIGDGGVDTRVRAAVPGDKSGFLGAPTCWQFKAEEFAAIRARGTRTHPLRALTAEVNKSEVRRLIGEGHAFRLALVGDLTPEQCRKWDDHLAAESARINPSAPAPRVVAADKLVAWARRFPAIVSMVRVSPGGIVDLSRWRDRVRCLTPGYVAVDNPEWRDAFERVRRHLTFGETCTGACLFLQGEAGVGKSRLTFEAAASLPESTGLLVYLDDEEIVLTVARALAMRPEAQALIIADECQLEARCRLEEILAGCADRVRAIAIDNSGQRSQIGAPEIWLEEMPRQAVAEILRINFPHVPSDRRRNYADLAGGFIRFAGHLCARDAEIAATRVLTTALGSVEQYLRRWVHDPVCSHTLDAIAMFRRLGCRSNVKAELSALCGAVGLDEKAALDAIRQMKDAPGFVAAAGRYVYVTPNVIARVAFQRGFERWIRDAPADFLGRLPRELQEQFRLQLKTLGAEEARQAVARSFLAWAARLLPVDLSDPETTRELCLLVETDPEGFLPCVRGLVAEAPAEVLERVGGRGWLGGWGPRRSLVWLCERLAAFPEYFNASEEMLFRLAVHESEPSVGNNATGIWRQLHSVWNSGTATAFGDRLAILERRLQSEILDEFQLARTGLSSIFDRRTMRMEGRRILGDRVYPSEWRPASGEEESECWRATLEVLRRSLSRESDPNRRDVLLHVFVEALLAILGVELLDEARSILNSAEPVSSDVRGKAIAEVDRFVSFHDDEKRDSPHNSSYLQQVAAWLAELQPRSFAGRLRTIVGRSTFSSYSQDELGKWVPKADVRQLADETLRDPDLLSKEDWRWLGSEAAASAQLFGEALGRQDTGGVLLPRVLESITGGGHSGLMRGYVVGQRGQPDAGQRLSAALDGLESTHPDAVVDLVVAGGDCVGGVERVFRLIDRRLVSPTSVTAVTFGVGGRRLQIDEARGAIRRLVEHAEVADVDVDVVEFIRRLQAGERYAEAQSLFEDPEVVEMSWRALRLRLARPRRGSQAWQHVLASLAPGDIAAAIGLAVDVLAKDGLIVNALTVQFLAELGATEPEVVVQAVGEKLLDKESGARFHQWGQVLANAPVDTVMSWVEREGERAAIELARHVPKPRLGEGGEPVVPELTLALLDRYEQLEEVGDNFVRSGVEVDMWVGNGAVHFRRRADRARPFLAHGNRWVRKWGQRTVKSAEAEAKEMQLQWEERDVS